MQKYGALGHFQRFISAGAYGLGNWVMVGETEHILRSQGTEGHVCHDDREDSGNLLKQEDSMSLSFLSVW